MSDNPYLGKPHPSRAKGAIGPQAAVPGNGAPTSFFKRFRALFCGLRPRRETKKLVSGHSPRWSLGARPVRLWPSTPRGRDRRGLSETKDLIQ